MKIQEVIEIIEKIKDKEGDDDFSEGKKAAFDDVLYLLRQVDEKPVLS
jgi:hypothetical protein